ncbi:DUF1648 domain-containing protein [Streptomyces triticagri]|uniref:DUF1648 domain-containing protein n=1 Tax=Streptomyces triticagri TaxID=2293568 RepID=A0A372M7B2_9ACTN|nr:DUF1648 domain-containing protein [Streptomyces triticagri]RFU86826.1 DUF1648 domain-containing protein [Streptomyces triticagri]
MNGSTPAPAAHRRATLAALPAVLTGLTVGAVAAAQWARLPDPVAVHFGTDGADRVAAKSAFGWIVLAVFLAQAVVLALVAHRDSAPSRPVYVTAFALPAGLGAVFVMALLANAAVDDALEAELPFWRIGVAALVALAAGLIGALLTPAHDGSEDAARAGEQPSSIGLGAGEQAVWVAPASPVWVRAAGGALTVAGLIGFLLELPQLVWIALPLGVVMLVAGQLRASVTRHGFALRLPWLPFPRRVVALAEVQRARAGRIRPLTDLGGWGYRRVGRRSGLAWASGEGLWIELTRGREFLIVVRDAKTAAALLNDLVARQGRGPEA